MANATVELIGGPRDGDRIVVDVSKSEWVVPAMDLTPVFNESQTHPTSTLRTARYRRVAGRRGEVAYEYVKGSSS